MNRGATARPALKFRATTTLPRLAALSRSARKARCIACYLKDQMIRANSLAHEQRLRTPPSTVLKAALREGYHFLEERVTAWNRSYKEGQISNEQKVINRVGRDKSRPYDRDVIGARSCGVMFERRFCWGENNISSLLEETIWAGQAINRTP